MSAERDACREWLDRVVTIDCLSGLYEEEDILEAVAEIIELELGGPDDELLSEYRSKVAAGMRERAANEKTWAEATVNDRIDAAFVDLNHRGIVAGQALGFTRQEGQAIAGEIGLQRDEAGEQIRGIAFYHRQDLERGVAGEGLLVAFAPWDSDEDAAWVEVGREVVHVLRHHGVSVGWDGTPDARIQIEPFAWRRRFSTSSPLVSSPAPAVPGPPVKKKCPLCAGKGWRPRASGGGSELCSCQNNGA